MASKRNPMINPVDRLVQWINDLIDRWEARRLKKYQAEWRSQGQYPVLFLPEPDLTAVELAEVLRRLHSRVSAPIWTRDGEIPEHLLRHFKRYEATDG